jgi:hypothetical protein
MIAYGQDRFVHFWSREGKLLQTLTGHTGRVKSVAFSPNGQIIASGSIDKTVRLWSREGKLLRTIIGHDKGINCLSFSPDGKTIAVGYASGIREEESPVKVWNLEGKLQQTLFGHTKSIRCVAFSSDGKMIASGSVDNTIRLWQRNGSLKRILNGHTLHITGVAFNHVSNLLLSGSGDGTARLWNLQTGKSISLISFNNGNWFIASDDGHFDCSAGGKDYVHFVRGETVYSPDQFWNDFYTPDLFQKFMKGEKLREITISRFADNAPSVFGTTPKNYYESEKEEVTIAVRAEENANGVGRVYLYHNARPIDAKIRGVTVRRKGDVTEFTLPLLQGANQFIAAARDRDNASEGRSESMTVYYRPKLYPKPDLHLVSIGVSAYQDQNIRLGSPNADAKAIADIFKTVSPTIYGKVKVHLLTDGKATKKAVLESLAGLLEATKRTDTVVIFLAGHGDTDRGMYYYLPFDADITGIKESCVSLTDLSGIIEKMPANRIALFLDTCQSGEAVKGLGMVAMSRSLEEKKALASLAKERGIALFSASNALQSAYEISDLGHGIFTWCMLDVLKNRKKELAVDKHITINSLLSRVNKMTRETARKYLEVEQSPTMYFFGDDFTIDVLE